MKCSRCSKDVGIKGKNKKGELIFCISCHHALTHRTLVEGYPSLLQEDICGHCGKNKEEIMRS